MAYRKKTLRRLTPEARKLAKLIGELESVSRRLKGLMPVVERLEIDVRAELKRQAYYKGKLQPEGSIELEQSNKGSNRC
ncbi:MAG: hypothetical protein FJ006_11775 [Chloroflexi bacterium]|nr:hypothetical protein [Chloroflexota bacterium]